MANGRYVQLVPGGHVFLADERDPYWVDDWAYEVDYHNGPYCAACLTSWCKHCTDSIYEEERCDDLGDENALLSFDDIDSPTIYRPWREED